MHAGAAKKQSSHRDYRVGGARKKSESAPFYMDPIGVPRRRAPLYPHGPGQSASSVSSRYPHAEIPDFLRIPNRTASKSPGSHGQAVSARQRELFNCLRLL